MGYACARWKLRQIMAACPWLRVTTVGGCSQVLRRLGIVYKRGRDYVHSPDPHYHAKLDLMEQARLRAAEAPARYVFLYADQLTYYRQPSVAQAFEAQGHVQPFAHRSHAKNTAFRVMATLDALTGQVTYRQRSHTDTAFLASFWSDLRQVYPQAETIYVVVDNWPVLFHPEVLAPLQPQHLPWPPALPPTWLQQARRRTQHDNLPIQLLCLPTYASWLNPIEKLWRWLKQDIIHLHRLSHDWTALRQAVADFLDRFATGSPELLRYTGLLPN